MAALHRSNTTRLREIVAEHGWPGLALAGADGAEAAWFIAQHAVLDVDFQRQALAALTTVDRAPKRCYAKRESVGLCLTSGWRAKGLHVGPRNNKA
jgi:hypothetical protein